MFRRRLAVGARSGLWLAGLACMLAATCRAARVHPADVPSARVDPRIELLAVVHSLAAESGPLRGFGFNGLSYAAAARRWFGPRRGHRAVAAYLRTASAGLDFVAAAQVMLMASDLPGLKLSEGSWREERGGGRAELEALLAAMADFARESRFSEFLRGQEGMHAESLRRARLALAGPAYGGLLERYTGLAVAAVPKVFLCLLCEQPESINFIRGGGGAAEIHMSLGPSRIRDGLPEFDGETFALRVWHELGHTLLDPLISGSQERIEESRALYGPVKECCRRSWQECAREHLVRGLAHRLWAWARVPCSQPTCLADEEVPYVDQVSKRLAFFEADRGRYPDLKAFFPRYLEVLTALAQRPQPGARCAASGRGAPGRRP